MRTRRPITLAAVSIGIALCAVFHDCKARKKTSQTISSESSLDIEERLRVVSTQIAGYLEDFENQDIYRSNQWFAPHRYARLSVAGKRQLGDPSAAMQTQTRFALDGPPGSGGTNTAANAEYRKLLEEEQSHEALLAAEKSRVQTNIDSLHKQSMCRIDVPDGHHTNTHPGHHSRHGHARSLRTGGEANGLVLHKLPHYAKGNHALPV